MGYNKHVGWFGSVMKSSDFQGPVALGNPIQSYSGHVFSEKETAGMPGMLMKSQI